MVTLLEPESTELVFSPGAVVRVPFACAEVRGGIRPVHTGVRLPGVDGVLYASPCAGAHGGDIHYLSVCGSGLLSRMCVADVAGHGDAVAAVSAESYAQLRRSVDTIDERRVLRALDRRITRIGARAMTTAVMATYFPPTRRLTLSYAGHPAAWLYNRRERRWGPVEPGEGPEAAGGFVGIPLGTGLPASFSRRKLKVEEGDMLLLFSDGVTEAASPEGTEFGRTGLARALEGRDDGEAVVDGLLAALREHTGQDALTHDDVTIFAGTFVPGPPGPVWWHVLRNRLGLGHEAS